MDEISQNELRQIIFNTLDFSRGVFMASKEYCIDNGIEFSGEVHNFIHKCLKEYHDMSNDIRKKINSN